MAYSQRLTDGYALNTVDGYSFTTNPGDKRNCSHVAVSVVFTGTLTGTAGSPDGYLHLETSNDVAGSGVWSQGSPQRGDDWLTYPGSTQNVNATAGNIYQWEILSSAHWIRVVFSDIIQDSGLSISVYVNGVIQDRG
jgi:hypothetical protein